MLSKADDKVLTKFVRDRVAWLCYAIIATYCYACAGMGPLMTFMREELQFNYTISAAHFSLWSLGVIAAGFIGDRCMKKFGRQNTVWIGVMFFCIGLASLISGRSAFVTIPSAFLCGLSGSTMAQTMSTILADRFLNLRAVAITESNIAASLCCSISPLFISAFSKTTLGWRAAMVIPIVAFACFFLFARRALNGTETEAEALSAALSKGGLPRAYWCCWCLVLCSVASEWSIIFWTADYLERVVMLVKADAAACVTSFLIAMVMGRILGSRLVREMNTTTLLRVASVVAMAGFSLFWTSKIVVVCLLGLFITGLGVSNFYPLTLSLAIASSAGRTGQATSRMSLASGSATLLAPFILGLLAERFGIQTAYGIIAALLVCCSAIIFLPIWSHGNK